MRVREPASIQLREAIDEATTLPVALVGVHNALVARLAERARFEGGWLSSLEISAVHGLPDRNLITLPEMLAVARDISASSNLPLIIDGDNGYGSVDTAVRAVRTMSASGIAGVCFEDNVFPKRNSLIVDEQPRLLEDEHLFARKLSAAAEAKRDPNFIVIARCESLIAGESVEMALARASRYVEAGADLILIHSREQDGSEAIRIAKEWRHDVPLVSIPTAFPQLSMRALGRLGYRVVIYANHLLRAALWGVEHTLAALRSGDGLAQLEKRILPLQEFLELTEAEWT